MHDEDWVALREISATADESVIFEVGEVRLGDSGGKDDFLCTTGLAEEGVLWYGCTLPVLLGRFFFSSGFGLGDRKDSPREMALNMTRGDWRSAGEKGERRGKRLFPQMAAL